MHLYTSYKQQFQRDKTHICLTKIERKVASLKNIIIHCKKMYIKSIITSPVDEQAKKYSLNFMLYGNIYEMNTISAVSCNIGLCPETIIGSIIFVGSKNSLTHTNIRTDTDSVSDEVNIIFHLYVNSVS